MPSAAQIDFGGFQSFVETQRAASSVSSAEERHARRPVGKPDDRGDKAARRHCARPPRSRWPTLPTNGEFALVLTRRGADGVHHPVAVVADDKMLDRAIRRAAPTKN